MAKLFGNTIKPRWGNDKNQKIVFYNYSLKTETDIKAIEKAWWMEDELTRLPDGRFSLEVEIENGKGQRDTFSVSFEDICVE